MSITTNEIMPERASSRRDEVALRLARGQHVARIAEQTGVGRRTIFRWMKDTVFARRVAELRREIISEARGRIVDCLTDAVGTLNALLKSDNEFVQLGAAKAILHFLKPQEMEDTATNVAPPVKVFVGINYDDI